MVQIRLVQMMAGIKLVQMMAGIKLAVGRRAVLEGGIKHRPLKQASTTGGVKTAATGDGPRQAMMKLARTAAGLLSVAGGLTAGVR